MRPARGSSPVGGPSKAVQHNPRPGAVGVRLELEDHTATAARAKRGGAIKISRSVKDEAGNGIKSIGAVREDTEAVQHALRPTSVRVRRSLKTVPLPKAPPALVVP